VNLPFTAVAERNKLGFSMLSTNSALYIYLTLASVANNVWLAYYGVKAAKRWYKERPYRAEDAEKEKAKEKEEEEKKKKEEEEEKKKEKEGGDKKHETDKKDADKKEGGDKKVEPTEIKATEHDGLLKDDDKKKEDATRAWEDAHQ